MWGCENIIYELHEKRVSAWVWEERERGEGDNKVGIDRERNSKCSNNVPVRNKYVNK